MLRVHSQRIFTLSVRSCATRSFDDIPGPKSFPLLGAMPHYFPIIGSYNMERIHRVGFQKLQQYGPVVKEEIVPGTYIVWLFKPEDIENLYRCEGKYPMRRSHLAVQKYRLDRPHLYNSGGLLPTNGEEWWRVRKIFQVGLSKLQNVRFYLPKSDAVAEEFLNVTSAGEHKQFASELERLYLELICLVVLDERLRCFDADMLKADSMCSKMLEASTTVNSSILKMDNSMRLWKYFNTPSYRKISNALQYLENIGREFLLKNIEKLKSSAQSSNENDEISLLERYLMHDGLDEKDVMGFALDMLLAGVETLTYTTSFAIYHLTKNVEKQDLMRKELRRLLPTEDSVVTEQCMNEATYTKAVMKEVFRLNPISVGIGRLLPNEAVFSNYRVPEGTNVVTQNQVSCRLPEYFSQPNDFIPERWLRGDPHYKTVHPYLVLPFGHGPRACIARRLAEQNIQLFLMKFFRKFHGEWLGSELESKTHLVNHPDGPIHIHLRPVSDETP